MIRSPWKGAVLKIEQAEDELNNRFFEDEDVAAYDFSHQHIGETTITAKNRQEVVTGEEKLKALKSSYADPFCDLLKQLSMSKDDIAMSNGYIAPAHSLAATVDNKDKDWLTTPLESIPERPKLT